MLCVDLTKLRTDPENVQKDVDLVEIINDRTRQYPSEEEAAKAFYAPLSFSVSVRSMYDNTVIGSRHRQGYTLYYTNLSHIGDFPHKGYDLVMYITSLAILNICNFSTDLERVMTQHSQFQPIGLFNPDPGTFDPMIYSHVILSDEGMKLLEPCLKPSYVVEKISEMKHYRNFEPLLRTIFEVTKKEENT